MVIAICPVCKARIEVDPAAAASICSACRKPIITEDAIKEYMLDAFGYMINSQQTKTPPVVNDPNFQIEDGELTKYKGNRRDVRIPDGVRGIAGGAFVNTMERIFVPKSVEYLKSHSLSGFVTFEDGCVLRSIEPNAFIEVICIDNFPTLADGCYKGIPLFNSRYFGISVFCKYSEQEFSAMYPNEDVKENKLSVGLGKTVKTEPMLIFDYVKTVRTADGWYVAVGKSEACIFGFDGCLKDVLVMPSECEGVKVTKLQNLMESSLHWSFKEIYLPKYLESICNSKTFAWMLEAETLHLPSTIKYFGPRAAMCKNAVFEERDGLPFIAVELIDYGGFNWKDGPSFVIAPYLKNRTNDMVLRYRTPEEHAVIVDRGERKRRYDSQKKPVKFISRIYKDKSFGTVTVVDEFGKTEYQINPSDVITVLIHDNDTVSVTVSNPFVGISTQTVPKGITECTVKENFGASWKLICK